MRRRGHGEVRKLDVAAGTTPSPAGNGSTAYQFGPFLLWPARKRLLWNGQPVAVSREGMAALAALPPPTTRGVPAPVGRLIGRSGVVEEVAARLAVRRLVTIVGAAGMGKTTIAAALTHSRDARHPDGACFVDLAPVANPSLVSGAVAAALDLRAAGDDPFASMARQLHHHRMLLVLDNCEHVVPAAVELCRALRDRAAGVRVLCTSRQPLRAEGETVYRLDALAVPPPGSARSASEALAFSAVEMFVERAMASLDGFTLTDEDVPLVVDLCRRLDGIPLAIELVAARVNGVGLRGLVGELERLRLRIPGRRTATSRHRTLEATLDWSFQMLTPAEQRLLRRLSVFQSSFSREAAAAVAADDELPAATVRGLLADLVHRSLVSHDPGCEAGAYRLLELTRAYGFERLVDSGESSTLRRRHARYLRDRLAGVGEDWSRLTRSEWIARYGGSIDDVRAALGWALGDRTGDALLGAELAAAATPVGWQLNLNDEWNGHVSSALAALATPAPATEMALSLALADLSFQRSSDHAAGALIDRPRLAALRGLELAEQLGDSPRAEHALEVLAVIAFEHGDYRAAMGWAQRHRKTASAATDPVALTNSDRLMSMALYHLGELSDARAHCERVLESLTDRPGTGRNRPVNLDWRISTRVQLARIAWLQGRGQESARLIEEGLDLAFASSDQPIGLAFALGFGACPLALWSGEAALARQRTEFLLRWTEQHALAYWHSWAARCYALVLSGWQDQPPGAETIEPALRELRCNTKQLDMLATLRGDLLTTATEGRVERGEVGWCAAEVLRLRGERELGRGGVQAAERAESLFGRALALARKQTALAWELRVSLSLARLWRAQGRRSAAAELLAGLLARCERCSLDAGVTEARAFALTCASEARDPR